MVFKDLALWSRPAGVPGARRSSLSPLGLRDMDALFDRFFGDLGFGTASADEFRASDRAWTSRRRTMPTTSVRRFRASRTRTSR